MSDHAADAVVPPKTTVLTLVGGLHFRATTPTGFTVDVDSRIDAGERAVAPSPMELQLIALGGCGAMDAISILRKMRQHVTAYEVRLTYTRASEHPKVYTSVQIVHALRGDCLAESNVHRAIQLTMVRYCPVFAMLYPKVAITEHYELTDEASGVVITGDVSMEEEPPESRFPGVLA